MDVVPPSLIRSSRGAKWFGFPAALLLVLALAGCRVAAGPDQQSPAAQQTICAVHFSPHGGCTEVVVHAVADAQRTVLVQAYSFTSHPIARALVAAHRRGVDVEVILDKSQQKDSRSAARVLVEGDIPVSIDEAHAIAHNKVIVIDGRTVLTGSFNFTEAAEERNAENLLEIQDSGLAAQYEKNWRTHRGHSKPFRPPKQGA